MPTLAHASLPGQGLTPWQWISSGRYCAVPIQCQTLILTALMLSAFHEVSAQPRKREKAELEKHQFSKIHGMRVENHDGEPLGHVTDFIFNLETGQVAYSLVQPNAFASLRSSSRIVQGGHLSSATIKKGVLELEMSLRRWKHAPIFKKSELKTLQNRIRAREIASYYGDQTPISPPNPTGPQDAPKPRTKIHAGELILASDLIGARILNNQNEDLGIVSDLLIDLGERKMPLAIISTKSLFGHRTSFLVALSAINRSGNRLTLETTHAKIAQASFFALRDWQSFSTNAIYRFSD